VIIDTSAESQSYVEDCEVCCNPIMLRYSLQSGEVVFFEAEKNQ
ncbi:MAG TPA: CPXCG motif-containing cysteine-rich protein, partial [Ignavibacteria bacterium]|nr:CPXCG motif-containing cysteine-rich protein [Ignavibacteria bacterium]